ncbi:putative quinol monooxygenase [Pendulispora albinea]|uniref:Antibiotic biosynthesis monooxygenase n=1 Tax=Pendulispora albinea TaxID=2741071 RepID=A0ABZ2LWE4_9BACT
MLKLGFLATLEAKPGKEAEVAALLKGAQALAVAEGGTIVWYAFQLGPRTFGIFDAFADEAGRTAHIEGPIAKALMGKADELLASPPDIRKVDVLAAK